MGVIMNRACSVLFITVLITAANAWAATERHEADALHQNRPVKTPFDLLLPDGEGPFPVIVTVHGSGGVTRTMDYNYYGAHMVKMGVGYAIPNSFINRGVKDTVADQSQVSHIEMMLDAFRVLEFLSKHPKVDKRRIGIVGFSKGGTVAMQSSYKAMADWLSPNGPRFALHVAFYPGCVNQSYDVRSTGAPMLVMVGEDDTWVNPKTCLRLANKIRDMNKDQSLVQFVAYPFAMHSFDSAFPAYDIPKGENYFNCVMDEQEDGSIVELATGLKVAEKGGAQNTGALQRAWQSCMTKGVKGGPDPDARPQSLKDFKTFVAKIFGLNVRIN